MKRLILLCWMFFVGMFSASAIAGVVPGTTGVPSNPVAQPNSKAFGNSLGEWMGIYWRQFLAGNLANGNVVNLKNVALLPQTCDVPPCTFNIQVKPGTALVLPLVAWLGFGPNDVLPDEWWGDPNKIFAEATLDGLPIAQPNAAYYTGVVNFDPPIPFDLGDGNIVQVAVHQSIGVVIKPLTPGVHKLVLHSEIIEAGAVFDNTWNITVVPAGKK
jgi:hypothetical protein